MRLDRTSTIITAAVVAALASVPALTSGSQIPSSRYVLQLATEYAGIIEARDVPFPDRSSAAIAEEHAQEDRIAQQLRTVRKDEITDAKAQLTYEILEEDLSERAALRVCRRELWDLSQTEGWQTRIVDLAQSQAVRTAAERRKVLQQWQRLPVFIDTDIANLRRGLEKGYPVPRAVVTRVERQLGSLLSDTTARVALDSPARRAGDAAFASAYRREMSSTVGPAIQRFQTFLSTEYAPHARSSLGISALPDGQACYAAYLRRYSTLTTAPQSVFALGATTVAASTEELRRIGRTRFGTSDAAAIVRAATTARPNRFRSRAELLEFSRNLVERAIRASHRLFVNLPAQPVVVRPVPSYLEHSGVSSHYEAGERGPAIFWIALDNWGSETRGAAEITVVHETVPGHHAQAEIAAAASDRTPLTGIFPSAAYVEGWANYAEGLAEEARIDDDDYERIQRRAIFGRSLVLDPGINVRGWTRDQAVRYILEAGVSRQVAEDLVDRVVVEPGQLTAYELGGLEIRRLRQREQQRLGSRFDIRTFHQKVLEHGPVPLAVLDHFFESR